MPEVSHVRVAVRDSGTLNRILREGGAQSFPQWLYAEPSDQARILWWGVRSAPTQFLDVPEPDDPRYALFPRAIDDWTEAPRGLVLVTVDADRAAADLAPALGDGWHDAGTDAILGATLPAHDPRARRADPRGAVDRGLRRRGAGEVRRGTDRGRARRHHRVRPHSDDESDQRRAGDVRAHRSAARADAHLPAGGMTVADPAHIASVEAWREERYRRLRSEIGWLTLAGLGWLKPGLNRIGSADDADVILPGGPPLAGTITVPDDGTPTADGDFLHEGAPVRDLALTSDLEGKPTLLELGALRLCLIDRGGRLAIRTWDTRSPHGPTSTASTTGRWIRHGGSRRVSSRRPAGRSRSRTSSAPSSRRSRPAISSSRSTGRRIGSRRSPGGDAGELWLIFGDATNGIETYGGGRYLYTDPPDREGAFVLDFNIAYNPPCVFSPFATCPLPWQANRLPIRVEAGEQTYRGY